MLPHLPRLASSCLSAAGALGALAIIVVACGSSDGSEFPDGVDPNDSGTSSGTIGGEGGKPDGGDPFANDPPPKWCGPPGQPEPPKPGGTEACPDDKNKPGCGCTNLGEKAPCWTGLRANRNLGACKDGQTVCQQINENTKAWGPCEGQVLPASGVTKGAAACKCFSAGQWKIANLSPAFITYNGFGGADGTYAVSTYLDGAGKSAVPQYPAGTPPPPAPEPGKIWSTDTLKVDCAGHFKLVLRIRQGVFETPNEATDCILAEIPSEADYVKENVEQPWPDLPGWPSAAQLADAAFMAKSHACAEKWKAIPDTQSAGYAEMVVKGLSVRCDAIDDGKGGDLVFNRVKYCPAICRKPENASLPECVACQQSGQGQF